MNRERLESAAQRFHTFCKNWEQPVKNAHRGTQHSTHTDTQLNRHTIIENRIDHISHKPLHDERAGASLASHDKLELGLK